MGRANGATEELSLPAPPVEEPDFSATDAAIAHLRRFSRAEFVAETVRPNPPELVQSAERLSEVIAEIEALGTPTLALDCEIAGMEAVPTSRMIPDGQGGEREIDSDDLVGGQLRLIQLAVHSPSAKIEPRQWLIDCFNVDARPLGRILADKRIQKVIHYSDFEQKQLMEKLQLEQPITSVYDTCRAWMSVQKYLRELTQQQRDSVGFEHWQRYRNELRHISHHLLGFPLDKDERLSDWAADPLDPDQLLYATMDVAVLLPLASRIKFVVRTLGLQKKVAIHIRLANAEVIEEVMKARQAA